MTTSLILRPKENPPIRVLEVDGPRHKHSIHPDDRAYYRLQTDNQPVIDPVSDYISYNFDPRLNEDFGEPYWKIYLHHDGRVEVHANRPTEQEIIDGDLSGALSSVIKIVWPCRPILRNALRLARRLCKADPNQGIQVTERDLVGIVVIESNIPVYLNRIAA